MISFSISLNNDFDDNSFSLIATLEVSGKPPRLEIITADPLLAASKLVLPKGSSHLEQAIEILTFFKWFKTYWLFLKPNKCKFLWLKINFSLGSSPKTVAVQSGYLSNILIIVFPKISYPLALFNLPTNEMIFFSY